MLGKRDYWPGRKFRVIAEGVRVSGFLPTPEGQMKIAADLPTGTEIELKHIIQSMDGSERWFQWANAEGVEFCKKTKIEPDIDGLPDPSILEPVDPDEQRPDVIFTYTDDPATFDAAGLNRHMLNF